MRPNPRGVLAPVFVWPIVPLETGLEHDTPSLQMLRYPRRYPSLRLTQCRFLTLVPVSMHVAPSVLSAAQLRDRRRTLLYLCAIYRLGVSHLITPPDFLDRKSVV